MSAKMASVRAARLSTSSSLAAFCAGVSFFSFRRQGFHANKMVLWKARECQGQARLAWEAH